MSNRTTDRAKRVDYIAGALIRFGGILIILTVVLMLLFILQVALPLILPGSITLINTLDLKDQDTGSIIAVGLDNFQEISYTITSNGDVAAYHVANGSLLQKISLKADPDSNSKIVSVSTWGAYNHSLLWDDGILTVAEISFPVTFSEHGIRSVGFTLDADLEFPAPAENVVRSIARTTEELQLRVDLLEDGRFRIVKLGISENFLGETETAETIGYTEPVEGTGIGVFTLDSVGQYLYAGSTDGRIFRWSLKGDTPELLDDVLITPNQEAITALTVVFGDITLAVADASGALTTWFPTSTFNLGDRNLTQSHTLLLDGAVIRELQPNLRNKSIIARNDTGDIDIYYLTSERHLIELDDLLPLTHFSINSKSNGLIALNDRNTLSVYDIHAPHPETSLHTLFGKVWYEKYPQPEYVWQSTGGTDEFEPKFSLMPLVFGSFKGTIYAMLFAIPLALGSAIYISQFTTHRIRGIVKPTVEIMASLPSVIIGFMIALWLAPILQSYILTFFISLVVLPFSIIIFFLCWHPLRNVKRVNWINRGYEFIMMTPFILLVFLVCHQLSGVVEANMFGGDFLAWLYENYEIRYDQRNAIIIAFGLGFAVIPIIFTLAEDALSNVPKSLEAASLAVGASRWQTVMRVILPSASPGIFAGIIIGFGRAVGETMIVLMATGNTPIMDWSIFNGMRTLSANIAVEIPEAPVDSTHYRVLFLSAVLLFLLTSILNTVAEIIRQRLRKRYGQFQ